MMIKKRKGSNPIATSNLFLISVITYIFSKAGGVIYNNLEWIWWVAMPLLFIVWFILNFKISRRSANDRR